MSERTKVQDPRIRCAAQIGWTYISQDDASACRVAERKRAGLEVLFRAMLGELMTGRVRVSRLIDTAPV